MAATNTERPIPGPVPERPLFGWCLWPLAVGRALVVRWFQDTDPTISCGARLVKACTQAGKPGAVMSRHQHLGPSPGDRSTPATPRADSDPCEVLEETLAELVDPPARHAQDDTVAIAHSSALSAKAHRAQISEETS
jgi:hypothetical protein